MSFKIASNYREAAILINSIPVDKFPRLLTRIFKKLHIKGEKLFSSEEESQIKNLFGLNDEQVHLVIDSCTYTFEQAAFTSTGPEPLYAILLEAGFDEPHAKILGRAWASEASEFISKLKSRTLGSSSLVDVNYHLNLTMGQSNLSKLQDPTAIFEFLIKNPSNNNSVDKPQENIPESLKDTEKFCIEFNHKELYSFFDNIELIQQQLDQLNSTTKS